MIRNEYTWCFKLVKGSYVTEKHIIAWFEYIQIFLSAKPAISLITDKANQVSPAAASRVFVVLSHR